MSGEKRTEMEQDAAPQTHCECGCSDTDPGKVVGWCFHCDHVYANYTPKLQDQHFANQCADAPETLKEGARARL